MHLAVRPAGLDARLPTTAVLGIARSIIRFVENVIPDPDDHGDTRATLETMRDEHLEWARTVQSMTPRPQPHPDAPVQ
ncbi:hypothetical protein NEH16_33160 [Streptomyces drozdowiczii]|uniref:Uncharacterized protein n=1 Tax=Streptomyces drozdowiczii TaxID=202862 RepID=A0ABY6Q1H5_9ACTN|nr:hypothetical protein [Streptomyces drozdowiczii]UZK58287.1 hypothetical protein NEH16_33160 [Streptomyces drozdowiczii]